MIVHIKCTGCINIMKYLDKNGYKGYIVEQAEAVLEDVFVSFARGQN